ncbi:MAG: thioesterase II family protein [Segniliparus sp.]|uniref:thioesterase II family protein n=1 Tax=Segniliparus sp. TaxID=2804064 RepID=UPI003F2F66C3
MPVNAGWIRQFHRPSAAETEHRHRPSAAETEHRHKPGSELPLLLVFPHAGSGASAYRSLSQAAKGDFEVVLFQYPGRQDRAQEPALATLPEIAAGAFTAFESSPWSGRGDGMTLVGHSMGALVAFEFARLAERAGLRPRTLCATASTAPHLVEALPPHPQDDQAILDHLVALDGMADNVLASQELLRMALPVVKKDYAAFDAYACSPPSAAIAAAIMAFGGEDDHMVPMGGLRAWSVHSGPGFRVRQFPGGHFFVNGHWPQIVHELAGAESAGAEELVS